MDMIKNLYKCSVFQEFLWIFSLKKKTNLIIKIKLPQKYHLKKYFTLNNLHGKILILD